jgi:hypothetical protein
MTDPWRMAFMFDARGGDVAALEDGLARAAGAIRRLAGDAHVRLGVAADWNAELLEGMEDYGVAHWRTVDGAVEISVAEARAGDLPQVCASLRDVLDPLAAPASVEVMAGPFFPMVTARDGEVFLSLAFKRFPGTTLEQFQTWWRRQHSGVAIPVLGPGLLAYDQVHVDHAATEALARAFGVAPVLYDAYDNLTWASREGYLASISDPEGMARIAADEVGRIDNTSRRHALMRPIG